MNSKKILRFFCASAIATYGSTINDSTPVNALKLQHKAGARAAEGGRRIPVPDPVAPNANAGTQETRSISRQLVESHVIDCLLGLIAGILAIVAWQLSSINDKTGSQPETPTEG